MATEAISAARAYVTAMAAEGVLAVDPLGLARQLKVDETQAIQLLAELQRREHLVKVGGFVYCASCGEATRLDGGTIDSITASARALVDKRCAYCGNEFPRVDRIEVRLSFFCSPAAKAAGTVHAGRGEPPATSSPMRLDQLGKLTESGDVYVNVAGEKGSVAVNSTVGNKVGGDFAGQQMNKAGGDQRVIAAPSESKSEGQVPLLKNIRFWIAVVTAVGGIAVAIIKLQGGTPSSVTHGPTPTPVAPVPKP